MTPDKAYSTASIGKAHLAKMGIRPLAEIQPDFEPWFHGWSMEGYCGGRVECHIRNSIQPVTYLDVLSMYPTVFVLQGLWWLVVAGELVIEDATAEIRAFVDSATPEALFHKAAWKNVPGLALIAPDFDLLPVRADYKGGGDYQIGLNHLRAEPMVYSVADILVSKLLTGRSPRIIQAFRLRATGLQSTLRPISLRGEITIDPGREDFFKAVIEARKAVKERNPLRARDRALQRFLKILANSTSYGIFGEFNETLFPKPRPLHMYGAEPKDVSAAWFEKAGRYCNPYIAACVTGAARLMLALMETAVLMHKTTYAMCDTDAMAIVDPHGMIGDKIAGRFSTLNPYAFMGSILKIEDENYDRKTKERKPLFIFSIASKRYVLFNRHARTHRPIIRKALEHGLGHLLPPPGETPKSWIKKFWYVVLAHHERLRHKTPPWFSNIAIAQLTISTPHLLHAFPKNADADAGDAISPFNFMLAAYALDDREGTCKKHGITSIGCRDRLPCRYRARCPLTAQIRPIAKYTKELEKPEEFAWWDAHTENRISVQSSAGYRGDAGIVPLKTFGDVFIDFVQHPEVKAADASGAPATADSEGELGRLRIEASSRRFISKEARSLEIAQVLGIASGAYREYDLGWPALKRRLARFPRSAIARVSRLSRSQVYELVDGSARPQGPTYAILLQTADTLEREQVVQPWPHPLGGRDPQPQWQKADPGAWSQRIRPLWSGSLSPHERRLITSRRGES